jgi:hypothetical protein
MAKPVNIIDGTGKGVNAAVDSGGYIRTQPSPYPADDNRDLTFVFREFLTLNNDGATTSMLVDGSTTAQKFFIEGESEDDIYVTSLSFLIQASGIVLGNDFAGSGAPLANGCRIYYEDKNGEVNIGTSLQTNFDFIRLCQGNPAFNNGDSSSGTGPFIAPGVAGSGGGKGGGSAADAIIPVLNIRDIFGLTYGLKLQAKTTHKLVIEINDNLSTGLGANAAFNIIAYGFKRIIN